MHTVPPLVWSSDTTRAVLVDERGWIEAGNTVGLEFSDRGDLPDLPPLSREGRSISASVPLRLRLAAAS